MSTYDNTFKVLLIGDESTEKSAFTKHLHCPYCDCKVEKEQVQNILKGKGIRCRYCYMMMSGMLL